MKLKIYNSKSKSKENFNPINKNKIRMYVCGPTVYDRAHIGNARPVIVFDLLYRLLRLIYNDESITYVRNITDVDDKIINRSINENKPVNEITSETIKWSWLCVRSAIAVRLAFISCLSSSCPWISEVTP